MPQSSADWTQAQLLHSQGLKYTVIAQRLGVKVETLRQYATRHQWRQKLNSAKQAVTEVVQTMVMREPISVQQRAEKWVEREINRVERITDVLDVTPIVPTIQGLREHIEVASMNGKYGRSTFGLDQQGVNVQINIGRFKPVEPTQDQPPIDVASVLHESTDSSQPIDSQ